MTHTISFKKIQSKPQYVISRYLLALVKKNYNENQWLYHNGNEGMEWAIYNEQVSHSYAECLEDAASRYNEDVETIDQDLKDWFYKIPISEVIDSLESNIDYYSPIKLT